ncbi:MAG TPA: integrase core domain-containing protein [Ktedonobacteraceae bacterium]|nr:integrase core domain-containing protein [Ktedonobacteraceae bacterium]
MAGNNRLWGAERIRGERAFAGSSCLQIEILKTPYHAPRANAICERFLGSVRRECLDHLLILHEKQLHRVLKAYIRYCNRARPHQGIKQQIPEQKAGSVPPHHESAMVSALLFGMTRTYLKPRSMGLSIVNKLVIDEVNYSLFGG